MNQNQNKIRVELELEFINLTNQLEAIKKTLQLIDLYNDDNPVVFLYNLGYNRMAFYLNIILDRRVDVINRLYLTKPSVG